ncbi:MAG: TAT-variant-translocated molybdopterin oxidoreductase [Bacteroidetes bacterium]|jgi:molybdopterin-containing oxidoreductase family iron-sulfur binding subunit|nr:TAT-variant-translocated molybdopterin oxidoreductase [Bacteroidota bacterium]
MEKQYYRSLDELKVDREKVNEKPVKEFEAEKDVLLDLMEENNFNTSSSRRDFLKVFGFSIASAAVLASCEQPVRKAIPYLNRPEEITPGKANYYASTYFDGNDYCSVLVKVRDGRPIKIEGNTLSSVTKGGTNARTQASVLSLYDNARYKAPAIKGEETTWKNIDQDIQNQLNQLTQNKEKIVLLTPTIISPSTKAVIEQFQQKYPTTQHIQYDAVSASGILDANKKTFGQAFIPSYHFEKAATIVSFGADFLGSWLSPVEYTKQYVQMRKLDEGEQKMSHHIHVEAGMSLTGSNADKRIIVKNSRQKAVIANVYNHLLALSGQSTFNAPETSVDTKAIAEELYKNRGKSLVVSGSNDTDAQMMVNGINQLLGNFGKTIDTSVHLKIKQGIDQEMESLVQEMNEGTVGGVIMWNVNPVYDYPGTDAFSSALKNTKLRVSLAESKNETAEETEYICPVNHYLESWNDAEIKTGHYSLGQPAIRPIFSTRQGQESLLRWTGSNTEYHEYLKNYWTGNLFPASGYLSADKFWTDKLHDGIYETDQSETNINGFSSNAIVNAVSQLKNESTKNIELELYQNVSVGNGTHANNPWLQELPDPVTKICWDNYAAISPKLAEEMGIEDNDLIRIDQKPIPAVIQPGQEYKTISVALGYGRQKAGTVGEKVGVNAYIFSRFADGQRLTWSTVKEVNKAGEKYPLARTQTHHSMEGRAIVREATLKEYQKNPAAGNELHEKIESHHKTLYDKHEFPGHHWGMAIDLNSCTGCNACVVGCSSENNVPVVGKKQVLMAREMHWIRIDRYYQGDQENPSVVRQPVMCQHCDNAPCENVCPVAATTHSNEGINQMAYNRCIGTRYCNNNCPYKVRRFNFYDYTGADALPGNIVDPAEMTLDLKRMVLNPDVTIRAKGVIEKCSFCVQRIQEKKLDAKLENRQLGDGEIKPACAQACPADAIVFGDLNDENSKVSKIFKDQRSYHLLEELHTLPSVGYLTKIRNKEEA